MKIDPKFSTSARFAIGAPETSDERATRKTPSASNPVARSDSVELSVQGRALSTVGELPAQRLTQIRARIDAGFYNDPHVAETVARRLQASGEI